MTDYISNKTILLTGGAGFVGQNVVTVLHQRHVDSQHLIIPRSQTHDLRDMSTCLSLTKNIDIVIHLAGNVGGIGYNRANPGSLFYDNIIMGVNLIEAARINKVNKFVCIGTICSYPKYTRVPFTEDQLWDGYPEETNAPYGLAKKALLVMLQAYRQQYGFNGIYLLPVNMYGPGDNFDNASSHVIPALIKKITDAKNNHQKQVTVWGDGSASREFLYVSDAAEAIVLAAERYDQPDPVNIGAGFEITIRELVTKLVTLMDYQGEIVWDKTKPNGQPRRCLDISRAQKEFGFTAKTPFDEGLKMMVQWYDNPRNRIA